MRACARFAQAHQIQLHQALVDLDRWHAGYRAMENTLADQAAHREQIAGRPVPTGRRRMTVPAQLPPDVPTFTGRTEYLTGLDQPQLGVPQFEVFVIVAYEDECAFFVFHFIS